MRKFLLAAALLGAMACGEKAEDGMGDSSEMAPPAAAMTDTNSMGAMADSMGSMADSMHTMADSMKKMAGDSGM